ncbi:hypothetical protein M513_13021 [Trichuris suis]|uniref:Uncharacterized protein n=1 Tax=Trichuris suis TaxID=68888 RepID=A0A085LM91_9BILA|nr:hypothetical protein M513_13021 [Trichuris suis]
MESLENPVTKSFVMAVQSRALLSCSVQVLFAALVVVDASESVGSGKGDEEARQNYSMTADCITDESARLWLELSRHVWDELDKREAPNVGWVAALENKRQPLFEERQEDGTKLPRAL